MNVNQFLGVLTFMGANDALSEEDRIRLEGVVAHHEQVIVELEAEMAIAQEALKSMMKERNEAHALLASFSATVDRGSLPHVIKREEILLGNIEEEIYEVECELHMLQGGLERQASNRDDTDSSHPLDTKHEIEEGQLRIQRLSKERENLSKLLDLHRDQLSPIRKVPPEIIRIIFLFWDADRRLLRTATHVSPNVLTGVCVAWKNIALGTPELWSSILVEIRKGGFYPDKRLVEIWLERSGSSALSFSIEERDPFFRSSNAGVDHTLPTQPNANADEHPTESAVSSVFDLFIPHYARWRKVHLRYKDAWSEKTGFASLSKDTTYPLLEELYLEKSYWLEQDDVDRITSMMLSAPRLHSVSWMSQKPFTMLTFPWAQLTHFSLGHIISMNEGLHILAICPQLKSLELTLILPVSATNNPDADDGPIVHNNLTRLYLSTAGNLGVLFDKLTLPTLKDLSLSEMHGVFPHPPVQLSRWPQSKFLAFLLRSGCAVRQFVIQECDISAEEIVECLAHPQISASLDFLSITEDHQKNLCVTEEVLRRLTYNPVVTSSEKVLDSDDHLSVVEKVPLETLCPNLMTIKLWGCISAEDGKVADMIESRWLPKTVDCPVMQLKMVLIGFFADACHAEDWARLETLNVKRFGITHIRL